MVYVVNILFVHSLLEKDVWKCVNVVSTLPAGCNQVHVEIQSFSQKSDDLHFTLIIFDLLCHI